LPASPAGDARLGTRRGEDFANFPSRSNQQRSTVAAICAQVAGQGATLHILRGKLHDLNPAKRMA
jgi:hypothetical protein